MNENQEELQSAPILTMQGIGKLYGPTRVLGGVDFDLRAGEVHALVGENGAGKSTLLNILSGVVKASEGTTHIDNKAVIFDTPLAAQKGGVGTVFQELSLISSLSISENVYPNRAPRNKFGLIDWPILHKKTKEQLCRLDLDELDPKTLVNQLPGSTQQLIEIAKALSLENQVLLLDEPTSALTPKEADALHEVIKKLTSKGIAIVYISHHMHDVMRISDRITVLRDGKKVGTFTTKDTGADEIVRSMVGRDVEENKVEYTNSWQGEMLRVSGLNKKGDLKDINFSLNKGEIIAVTGLVGSGCHALGRVLAGADTLDGGEIYLKDKLITLKEGVKTAKHLGIAFLPEDRKSEGLFLNMSISDNIVSTVLDTHTKIGCVNQLMCDETAKSYIRRLKIRTDDEHKHVGKLSGGNQQKVLLGKWLETQPDLLIISEPTKGIDIGAKFEIHDVLRDLASHGVSVIVISSDLPEVLQLSSRMLVMKNGSIVGELPSQGTREEDILAMAAGL